MSSHDDDDFEPEGAWKLPAIAAMVPFCMFLFGHQKGLTVKAVEVTYKYLGPVGLLGLPVSTLSMEKCVYDTVNSYQGKDPNERPKGIGEGFPSGGCNLPSFSLIPINQNGAFYRPPKPSAAASHTASSA